MSKPIKATPTLSGRDANKFIKNMLKKERSKPTRREIRMVKEIKKVGIVLSPDNKSKSTYKDNSNLIRNNLSDKIERARNFEGHAETIHIVDVKEFIRLLKEEIEFKQFYSEKKGTMVIPVWLINIIIDKLAGPKLIINKNYKEVK